jgi:ribosomal protein S25
VFLIDYIAFDLLDVQSYRIITIRQLGERAGVNSAMIRALRFFE